MIKKMPAANGRFGASGAVSRPKVCADLQVLRPSERQCKPRLRQTAGTFGAMAAVARRQFCGNLYVITPQQVRWKPPLRQAALTLAAISADTSVVRLIFF